jgi:hypothetical protein
MCSTQEILTQAVTALAESWEKVSSQNPKLHQDGRDRKNVVFVLLENKSMLRALVDGQVEPISASGS